MIIIIIIAITIGPVCTRRGHCAPQRRQGHGSTSPRGAHDELRT